LIAPTRTRAVAVSIWRRRKQHLAEQAKAHAKAFQAKKKTAKPVLLADLERDAPENLRAALEQLDRIGGRVRIAAGRLIVEMPPSELGQWAFGAKRGATLATILYRCEPAIREAMSGKDGVLDAAKAPDRPLLPSGQMAP
jgi:hypothetical protein